MSWLSSQQESHTVTKNAYYILPLRIHTRRYPQIYIYPCSSERHPFQIIYLPISIIMHLQPPNANQTKKPLRFPIYDTK